MKKLLSLLVVTIFSASFVFTSFALAKEEKIKGINDRGPATKMTFIHYKKNPAKPDKPGKPGGGASSCYGFLANSAEWKSAENYLVNPTNSGLDGNFVKNAIDAGVSEWEKYGGNIFGIGYLDWTATISSSLDNKNVAAFDSYSDDGVIAVATVWGYFYGNPKNRELIEWDILFNTHYNWGEATGSATVMDVQNIATHELGHAAGLKDLYESSCIEETMYGYSDYGEVKKRDLNAGDIEGIKALYQ